MPQSAFSSTSGWVILSEIEARIKAKIEEAGTPLKDWDVQINYGIKTGFNEAFIIDQKKRDELVEKCPKADEIIRPILRGKHIKQYVSKMHKEWIIIIPFGWTDANRGNSDPEDFIKQSFSVVYDHFIASSKIKFKGKGLFKRDDQGKYWWELRACDYLEEFSKEKLIYIDIMTDNDLEGYKFPAFSYARNEVFTLNTSYFMVGDEFNLKYILGVLNSKLGKFIVKTNVTVLQKRQYRLFLQFVAEFKIPTADKLIKDKIISFTNQIIEQRIIGHDTLNLEALINQEIYNICNFTDEESYFLNNQE
ncbi:TaqI-like C-terminal specificity domain-containing protein [Algoriphagus sp. D3-2-R+10]|uniref:TaqI-like C-terminal specificity domain-containing protein n=1 Tax=Algoriphagus aurantiacus TaxID=3103948 RepID=UPI002B379398|nr:TaqI-like C-terminal specificity domain-containing protein [Algoriphagus sp. D3-2-R+10]MEB2773673.1 TaqI-like C-terminal specificity domain-containing protein [Algoriphagus sp. D3-2-R+10]